MWIIRTGLSPCPCSFVSRGCIRTGQSLPQTALFPDASVHRAWCDAQFFALEKPRPYSLIVLFTASGAKYKCTKCKYVLPPTQAHRGLHPDKTSISIMPHILPPFSCLEAAKETLAPCRHLKSVLYLLPHVYGSPLLGRNCGVCVV
jgi:hypothetical protein